ncbi:MAG: DNA starvation/stationary phase protection protein, partial [Alphaproteobacteria bacterium]
PADLTMREMLAALLRDSRMIAKLMRRNYALCSAHDDFTSARLLEDWIDEAEGRYWFLFEMHRDN